jgi:ATP citrate (pro-S)-lyase
VGDVDAKAQKLLVPTDVPLSKLKDAVCTQLLKEIKSEKKRAVLWDFIARLYAVYLDLNFTCRLRNSFRKDIHGMHKTLL